MNERIGFSPRLSLSGRASVAVLGVVLTAAVTGTLLGARHAVAQAPAAPPAPIDFGPVGMVVDGNVGVGSLTIKALYPIDATDTTPFRVEAFTNYVTASLDIAPSATQNIHELYTWFATDSGGKMRLWIEDLATGAYSYSKPVGTESDAFYCAPRIHPAIKANGKASYPLSAVESANVVTGTVTEDGFEDFWSYTFEVPPAPKGGLGV
ncbi:MAG TPA: hypothetical protein VKT78_18200 [Fimbriimonadaceae bacterium]|nr:hypothetical protein [Fimbriimonadaceae bacterium]